MNEILSVLRPIQNKRQHKKALRVLRKHFNAKGGTRLGNLIAVLSFMIEKYEQERFPIKAPSPIMAVTFRMEQLGIDRKRVAQFLGGKNRASEFFNGKRQLTKSQILSLHQHLGIPADSLLGVN